MIQTNKWTQKRKKSKNTNTVVNAGPPDTEYLYYPLDVEGVTLKSSLLPASTSNNDNIEIIMIIKIRVSTSITFIYQS